MHSAPLRGRHSQPRRGRCPPGAGLIVEEEAIQMKLAPKRFGELAKKACTTGLDQFSNAFPKVGVGAGQSQGRRL